MTEKTPSKKTTKTTATKTAKTAAKETTKTTAKKTARKVVVKAAEPTKAAVAVEEVIEDAPIEAPAQEAQGFEAAARRVFGQVRDTAKSLAHDAAGLVRNRPWQPPVDVFVEGDEIVLKADLPGVEPGAVEVAATPNSVVLRGSRPAEAAVGQEESGSTVIYELQRRSGAFHREVSLPHPIDSDNITAKMARGVLEVRMPIVTEKTVTPS